MNNSNIENLTKNVNKQSRVFGKFDWIKSIVILFETNLFWIQLVIGLAIFTLSIFVFSLFATIFTLSGLPEKESLLFSMILTLVIIVVTYVICFGSKWRYNSLDKALAAISLEVQPESYKFYCERGCAKFDLRNYTQAIEEFDKALKINPRGDEAWNYRGYALAKLGEHTQAMESFQKAVEINPKNHETWYNIGNVHVDLKNYQKAVENYQKALQINPNFDKAKHNLYMASDGKLGVKIGGKTKQKF